MVESGLQLLNYKIARGNLGGDLRPHGLDLGCSHPLHCLHLTLRQSGNSFHLSLGSAQSHPQLSHILALVLKHYQPFSELRQLSL